MLRDLYEKQSPIHLDLGNISEKKINVFFLYLITSQSAMEKMELNIILQVPYYRHLAHLP